MEFNIDRKIFLLHYVIFSYSLYYFFTADWHYGTQEIAAVVSMWFMFFALISLRKGVFRNEYVSISMLLSFLVHELPYIEYLDLIIKSFANGVDTPSRLYFYTQAFLVIPVLISFYFNKKTFFRIFSITMFLASLSTLILLHYLQFSINTKSFVETRNVQIENIIEKESNPMHLCNALMMDCEAVEISESGTIESSLAEIHPDLVFRLNEMPSNEINYFTWSFADSDNKFRLYSVIKNGPYAFLMVDQEITNIHLTRSTKTFIIQYLMFAIIWSTLGIYLITRHQRQNKRLS